MVETKKKRTRQPGAVRVTVILTDEDRIAIGGGTKATNGECAEWVQDCVKLATPAILKEYYRQKLADLEPGGPL